MTVDTGGPLRGLVGRWLMRFEASSQIFRLAFLAAIGYPGVAPYVLGAGLVGSPVFAWTYVEWGLFNRKNRERNDRGDNFAAPGAYIGSQIQTQAFAAALAAADDGEDPREAAAETVAEQWQEYRDGVALEDIET